MQQHHQHPLNLITSNSNNHLLSGLTHLPYDSTCTDLSLAFARLQSQANGHMGYDHFEPNDHHNDQLGFLDAITPNGFHNVAEDDDELDDVADDDDDEDLLFFLHPPPTGTFLNVPPLVQYLRHDLQKYLG
uniref:DOF zinc finger protein DOF2.1-like n=1 Tax=Tanacetum cinerariifolium TaxID=118510 RepID=A0A6L2L9S2_TANCI|nr:DOF zinc finger protein DOF2.1-like [Tanacetum cinerariifolium]